MARTVAAPRWHGADGAAWQCGVNKARTMTKMAIAARTRDLNAPHAHRVVLVDVDRLCVALVECGPTAAALELRFG